ncbi:MAG TPA: apolipoprotein N-acyltransferase [Candidatus Angelobacter sp.]|nr:apolipoprotein N-acyltransferase [Candidatus Angelobacter sp.]
MPNIPPRALLFALLSAGLQIVIFPNPRLYFLCWIAVVPLLYVLLRGRGGEGELLDSEGRSLRQFTLWQGFVIGWISGVVWYMGTCYWIYSVMHGYGNLGVLPAALIMLGFCLIMGMHHGVFGLLVVLMARRSTLGNRRPLLLAPVFWTALEFFRERVVGVPWNPLGNAQVDNVPFTRIAEVTGVYGLSFAVMLVNCAFVLGLLLHGRRRVNLLISALAATVILQIGVFAKPAPLPADREAVMVQQNIPVLNNADWTPDFYERTVEELSQITLQASPKNPDGSPGLIIWPESPAPFFINDPKLRRRLEALAKQTNSALIAGSLGQTESHGPEHPSQLLNSALVIDPQGNIVGQYDKIHLVPFGEYIPMQSLLFFASKLTREVGDFARGTERKVFDLNGTKVGVFICYESVFPGEIRHFANNGAQVFINISNDGWYGETSAPFQHLDMTRMRAIENHRWLLLSTNSGTTASIDPLGRVVKKAERNVRTALVAPFAIDTESTFYSRNGDVFAWGCVVISLLALFARFRISARTTLEARAT